jgi:uncharacterized protein (DUF433 family)
MKLDRITTDPARMNGQPCVRSMRLTVRRVVELAADYRNRMELYQEYPEVEDEDVRQALLHATVQQREISMTVLAVHHRMRHGT